MTGINSSIVISVLGLVFVILSFFFGRSSAARQDGKQDGTILSELGYIKSSMETILRRLDKQDERDREYISRLTCVEQKIELMYHRNVSSNDSP